MSKVNYNNASQYYTTNQTSWCLNLLNLRVIDQDPTDVIFVLSSEYNNDPYKLANDLYNNSNLWWVFMIVNPDVIIDPINDMQAGITLRIPTKQRIKSVLGV